MYAMDAGPVWIEQAFFFCLFALVGVRQSLLTICDYFVGGFVRLSYLDLEWIL